MDHTPTYTQVPPADSIGRHLCEVACSCGLFHMTASSARAAAARADAEHVFTGHRERAGRAAPAPVRPPRHPQQSLPLERAGSLDAVAVELDAGESYAPPRGMTDVPLLDEPWKLVVPAGALLSHDVIDLSRLGMPWLGLDPAAASAQAVRRVRRELGGEESTQHTFFSYQNALALVAAGQGVTLAPALALESLPTKDVDLLDIPGLGMRRVVLRHLTRSRAASPTLATATALIREAAAAFSYESSGM